MTSSMNRHIEQGSRLNTIHRMSLEGIPEMPQNADSASQRGDSRPPDS